MLKRFLVLCLSTVSFGLYAGNLIPHEPCIDIDGTNSKIAIMPGVISGKGRLENPVWMGENKAFYLRLYHPKVENEAPWIPVKFSFIPATSGKVIIWIRSNQAFDGNKKIYPTWVEYKNLSITGCTPDIHGFSETDRQGKKGWHLASSETLIKNGKNDTVKVWHDCVAFRYITVTEGQEVTISAEVRYFNK
ncbi:MAG: hypothetical protein JXR78_13725 [Victivallales bacterium]|nr:hypothetical protein [Victivallales bacterium]